MRSGTYATGVKHAGTNHATVKITHADDYLIIRVMDGGRDFDTSAIIDHAERESGFRLYSVRERIGLFGGRLEIESAPGEGTCVTLHIPAKSDWQEGAG